MNYIVAPITTYNEDDELFETKIAADAPGLPIICAAYGPTEEHSIENAVFIAYILKSLV